MRFEQSEGAIGMQETMLGIFNTTNRQSTTEEISAVLWDHLGRQVRGRHDVNNIRDLERALQAEWVRIRLQVIRKLICSMRLRCLAVLAANGGNTRY